MAASGAARAAAAICALGALVVATKWVSSRARERTTIDVVAPSYADEGGAPEPSPPLVKPAPQPRIDEPTSITTPSGRELELYPPLDARLRRRGAPIVLMLHGMGGDPHGVCDFWSQDARATSWLACPVGNVGCCGQFDWKGSGEEKAHYVDEALDAVRTVTPRREKRPPTLIGFSRGAFVARDVIYARPGVFDSAILIGAALNPDPARFKASGIRRVVLASGDYDGARASMTQSAKKLEAAGIPARFVSLGRIGHALPADLGPILREALQWVREAG